MYHPCVSIWFDTSSEINLEAWTVDRWHSAHNAHQIHKAIIPPTINKRMPFPSSIRKKSVESMKPNLASDLQPWRHGPILTCALLGSIINLSFFQPVQDVVDSQMGAFSSLQNDNCRRIFRFGSLKRKKYAKVHRIWCTLLIRGENDLS